LKNISEIGNLPQVGVKIKNVGNHQLDVSFFDVFFVIFDTRDFGQKQLLRSPFSLMNSEIQSPAVKFTMFCSPDL